MKLLRYGPPGQEKPGLLDRDGGIRDLSGIIHDIDGAALAPASLTRLKSLDVASLPLVPGGRGSAPASPMFRNSSQSGSTIACMRRRRDRRSRANRSFS